MATNSAYEKTKTNYFNQNYGGVDSYAARQQQRYNEAVQTGNSDLINRLAADAQRVGYQLNSPVRTEQPVVTSGGGGGGSSTSYINQLNEARKQQTLSQLQKSKDAALSTLNQEKASVAPRYYDARNQTASSSQQQFRNFAEYMAARGGTGGQGVSSGSAAQAELMRQGSLQGNLGFLNRQEQQAFDDVARRTSDVENAYESDYAAAVAGLEAARMEALLNQFNADRQYGLQEAGLTGYLNNLRTLQGQSFDWGRQMDTAGLTGYLNGQRTLPGQQFDRGVLESDRAFEYQQARDQIADERYKQEFDEDVRRYGLDYAMRKAESNNMIANRNADNTRQSANAEFNRLMEIWKATGSAPAGLEGITPGTQWAGSSSGTAKPSTSELESEYVSNISNIPKANLKAFFAAEEANIVRDLGIAGYNRLYNRYFDDLGNPK